jgi:Flp pilus assembly protein TadD
MNPTKQRRRNGTGYRRSLPVLMAAGLVLGSGGCGSRTHQSDIRYSNQHAPRVKQAKRQPPTAQTLYSMARVLAAQHKDDQCLHTLTRIIRKHPKFMPAYCELAELHLRHERVEDALHALAAALEHEPDNAYLLNNIGMCLMLDGDYEQSLAAFTQAAGSMPIDARFRANMAVALGKLGRYEESLALYKQVVPTAEAYYNLGVLCKPEHAAQAKQEMDQLRRTDLALATPGFDPASR